MKTILWVGLGGALGSILRYLIGLIPFQQNAVFPYKTLAINVLGCFLIGILACLALGLSSIDPDYLLFLKVGFCGGFTTFSTFALETTDLFATGKWMVAVLYCLLSFFLCIAAVYGGEQIGNHLIP